MSILTFNHVYFAYNGQYILKDLSFDLKSPYIYCVLGPSGFGKSTFLRLITGKIKPYSGELLYNNNPFYPNKTVMGIVPQNYGLLPWQTGQKSLEITRKITTGTRLTANDKKQIDELLTTLQIRKLQYLFSKELSGGQQQRFAIAKALIANPDILLMDEPFSSVDDLTRENLQRLFLSTIQKRKILSIFVTHNIEEALLLGDFILFASCKNTSFYIKPNPLIQLSFDERKLSDRLFCEIQNIRSTLFQ